MSDDASARAPSPAPPAAGAPASQRPRGEAWVWLTGLGLTSGLVMVALLLAVVVVNGIAVFWPQRVELFTVRGDGDATWVVAGEVVRERSRRDLTAGRELREIQVFAGNKDAYGDRNFRYLDVERIVGRERPSGILVIERVTQGDCIAYPVELRIKGRPPIPAGGAEDPDGFFRELARLLAEVAARRAEILDLEKNRIGAISARLNALELRGRLARVRADTAEQARIAADTVAAMAEEAPLKRQAAELRARQNDHLLVVRLATGEQRRIVVGDLVGCYAPNALGWWQRCGRFLGNLWSFVWDNPREANTEGGIFPAIVGTFVMTLLMSVAVVPFGVLAAIYLREYARQGLFVRAVRIAVNNLAGVPSIVFGVFGLGFFVYFLGGGIDALFYPDRLAAGRATFGTGGLLWSALTLALMTVPVVIVATEEAIAAVPRGMREGSLACGASKWQTMQRIVLPASAPGILTGMILAMARGAGEVAPLMLVGVVKLAPGLPIDGTWKDTDLVPFAHLDQKFMHLGFHIFDLGFQSQDSEAAKPMVFATTLFLIGLVVLLNLGAIRIRERLRRKYRTSAF